MTGIGALDPANYYSVAWGVSTNGSVIVGRSNIASGVEAFRWEDGTMIGLGDFAGGAICSEAYDVSADGSVIVGYSYGAAGQEAFIWDELNGMRSIAQVLTDAGLDLTGWTLKEARGISANGLVITGYGINPNGREEAWIATIPEPATILLLGLGSMALRKKYRA
jgi:probable HAF family extracellular repeat protein